MAEISISTINVADGRELGDSARVFTLRPNRHNARPSDTLIVFVDLPTASAAILQETFSTLSESYQRAPGGAVTALRLAIKLANEKLAAYNLSAPQPVRGSLSCAVISGENCVVAQAGPAVAYGRASDGTFERIAPPARTVLFGSGNVEVYVAHIAWRAGDAFVLSGSTSMSPDTRINEALIEACMGRGDGRMIAGYLNANVKSGFMTGVAFTVGAPPAPPDMEPPAFVSGATHAGETAPGAASVALPPRTAQPVTQRAAPAVAQTGPTPQSARLPATIAGALLARVRALAARATARTPAPARPERKPIRVSPGTERAQKVGLAAIALVLPVVVAVITGVFALQLSGDSERQQARAQVQQRIDAARARYASDPGNAAPLLQEALDGIRSYEQRAAGDTSYAAQKTQVQQQLDTLLHTRRAPAIRLADFKVPGPRRVAGFDSGAYVLNPATNSVDQYVINAERDNLIGPPRVIAPQPPFSPTAPIRDVTWATPKNNRWPSGDGALLFTGDAAYYFSQTNDQLALIRLPPQPSLPQPIAGDMYGGQFYQLDAATGQVWRYRPQGDAATATPYLAQPLPALRDGIDMAIDGGVFVLRAGGSDGPGVIKLLQGTQRPFALLNAPEPLRRPVAIAVSNADPDSGSVFVGDAATGAIHEYTKTGEYVRELRSLNDEFVDMVDMSYDFSSDTFYVVTARRLYAFHPGP